MKLLVKERNRLTLPKEVLPEGTEILDLEVDGRGRIILTPLSPTPTSQLYYRTPSWQKAEHQANLDAKSGRLKQYASADDLFNLTQAQKEMIVRVSLYYI